MGGEPTIYDVARNAGVSISTVSRVLNGHSSVLTETRERVQRAVHDLEFTPNPIARGLVVKHTNVFEVFFSWPGYTLNFYDSWYMSLLTGISEAARENQYGVLINTLAGPFDRTESYERAFGGIVDGILLLAPQLGFEMTERIMKERVPVVIANCRSDEPRLDWVDTDNAGGAALVAEHLAQWGHRKIAVVTGPIDISQNAAERLRGFDEKLTALGLPTPDSYRVEGDFTEGSGEKALDQLMALKEPPTAVFCCNDSMALGVIRAFRKRGWTPGKEMAVVGYDNIHEAAFPEYDLTTVDAQTPQLGREVAKVLVQKMQKSRETWIPQHLVVPVKLVVRSSSGLSRKH
jgi:DNA-binding LacI/PurR family transcriptional regulator